MKDDPNKKPRIVTGDNGDAFPNDATETVDTDSIEITRTHFLMTPLKRLIRMEMKLVIMKTPLMIKDTVRELNKIVFFSENFDSLVLSFHVWMANSRIMVLRMEEFHRKG